MEVRSHKKQLKKINATFLQFFVSIELRKDFNLKKISK